jgi:hypothetical protein
LDLEDRLTQRKIRLANEEVVRRYVADLQGILANSLLAEQKAFIRSFVKDIKVTGGDVLLTYTIPLPLHGVLREPIWDVDTVQPGGPHRTTKEYVTLLE